MSQRSKDIALKRHPEHLVPKSEKIRKLDPSELMGVAYVRIFV